MELFRADTGIHTNPPFISTLTSAVSATDTSFTVATGAGALLPSPTGGDYFRLRIGTNSAPEVVKVTARSGDVCTCDALTNNHTAGDDVIWTVSGETLEGLQNYCLIKQIVCSGSPTSISIDVPNNFTHLMMTFVGRSTDTAHSSNTLYCKINDDDNPENYSSYNYLSAAMGGMGNGSMSPSTQGLRVGDFPGTLGLATAFADLEATIRGYRSPFRKFIRGKDFVNLYVGGEAMYLQEFWGIWKNTAEITKLTYSLDYGGFADGSVISFFWDRQNT